MYIEVKKIELFDFREHEEKIEFKIPKKFIKLLEKQKKESADAIAKFKGKKDIES
jgi:hypothetical protein